MSGFRQQPQATRKEKLRSMEAEMKNTQMALRINQMMVQQLVQNNQNVTADLSRALNLINELQYKTLAMQKVANLDLAALNAEANVMRLNDFNAASDKEDFEKNFDKGIIADEDAIVIITTTVEGDDNKGIFRSKFKLSDCGVPDLIKGLLGREVGAKCIVKLNGEDHTVELLGVRRAPKVETQEAPAVAVEAVSAPAPEAQA